MGGYESGDHNSFGSGNAFTRMLIIKKLRRLREEQQEKKTKKPTTQTGRVEGKKDKV